MSAKFYCDVCRREMRKADHERLRLKHGNVRVEVMSCYKRVWNGGHVCHKCIRDVIQKGKADT